MTDKDKSTRTVRTKFQPDTDVEVGPQEYLDLERQGLLVQGKKTADKSADKKEG